MRVGSGKKNRQIGGLVAEADTLEELPDMLRSQYGICFNLDAYEETNPEIISRTIILPSIGDYLACNRSYTNTGGF